MKAAKTTQVYNNMDEKHNEMLEKFRYNADVVIPQLECEIAEIKQRIKRLLRHEIDTYMDLKDEIKEKKQEIKQLKQQHRRYLLDNSKYIFQYFEQKKNISSGQNTQNTNALNKFFKVKGTTDESSNLQSAAYRQSRNAYHQYWKNVNNHIINIQDYVVPSDTCVYCQTGELIPQDEEGVLVCNNMKCGRFVPYIVDVSKPVNKEPPSEVSYTAYNRLNHFKEVLSQFQAKETTQIPDEVFSAIKARIKKERIDVRDITYDKMREILKKLELNKYFEHIQYINSMFGIKPPIMSEELHETLCILFIEVQQPWARHIPAHRINFFNYAYTLYQLCVLLDQTQYLPYIPMLKDREKQLEQDMIWKNVCQELNWEFFPTV